MLFHIQLNIGRIHFFLTEQNINNKNKKHQQHSEGEKMTVSIEECKCGHLRSEHFDFIRSQACQRCNCNQYEQIMKCSECGKEIQNDEKLCKECKMKEKERLLREKIISANYNVFQRRAYPGF